MRKLELKKDYLIALLFFVIALVTVGYAILQSNLKVRGTVTASNNGWNIYFDNVVLNQASYTKTLPTLDEGTALSFNVELDKPGDFYEFTVDAVNKGTLDAMINSISISNLTQEQEKLLDVSFTYANGNEVKKNDALMSNTSKNIKVYVKYKDDVDGEDLPDEDLSVRVTIAIDYVQLEDCPNGSYRLAGSTVCSLCPAGSICPNVDQEPELCPAGSYSPAGSTSCSTCPAGTYSKSGAASCTPCPAGSICTNVSEDPNQCPAGTYSQEGSTSCTTCPAGSSCATSDQEPEICPAGTYSQEGSSECSTCPTGQFSFAGSESCYVCPAGQSCSNGLDSQTCPAGTYSAVGSGVCSSCPTGTYSLEGAESCTTCPAGSICTNVSEEPKKCPAGTYSPAGSTSCSTCPAGTYSSDGSNSCSPCAENTYSQEGSTSCTACEIGYESGSGASVCTKRKFTISYSPNGSGTSLNSTITKTTDTIEYGGEVTNTLSPKIGYYITSLTCTNNYISSFTDSYLTPTVNRDKYSSTLIISNNNQLYDTVCTYNVTNITSTMINYSNSSTSSYTSCKDTQCAIDDLYAKMKEKGL